MVQIPLTTHGEYFERDGSLVKWVKTQYENMTVTKSDIYDTANQQTGTETETATTTQLGVDGSAHVTTVTDSDDLLTGDHTHQVEQEVQQPHDPGDEDFPTHSELESTTTDSSGQTTETRREIFDRDDQGNTSKATSETDTTGLTTVVATKLDPGGNGTQVTDILDADGNLKTQDDEIIGNPDLNSPFFVDGQDGRGTDTVPGNNGRPGDADGEPGEAETDGLVAVVIDGGNETGEEGETGSVGESGDLGESVGQGSVGEPGEVGTGTSEAPGFSEAQTVGELIHLDPDLDR